MTTRNRKYNLVDESVSETSPHILLHPLVLVSQDDHATRSNVRKQGPIIGAILGQQNGKDISMEFAFECGSQKLSAQNDYVALDHEWFSDMLIMCKLAS
jgi:COP9 signalosome complex subunit 6